MARLVLVGIHRDLPAAEPIVIGTSSRPIGPSLRWQARVRKGVDTRRWAAVVFAVVPLGIGAFVLASWLLRPWLALDVSSLWLMKANTALCVVATSLGVLLLVNERRDIPALLHRMLGALVFAITFATLVEYATGRNLGIDQLLAADPSSSLPGRMSLWTAAIFALFGATTLFHAGRLDRVADVALIGAGVALQLVWAGYLYDVLPLYGVDRLTLVSPQTLVCASSLGIALVTARLTRGALAIASRATAGGALVRVLLPVAWVLPLLLGWLRLLAESEGLIGSTSMGVALFAVTQTLVLAALIYWSARRLDGSEARYVEERERREELQRLVAICAWTGRVRWNGEWVRVERYLKERFGVEVTHTISDEAMEGLEPDESPKR